MTTAVSNPTPTDPTAARIARALVAGGLDGWRISDVDPLRVVLLDDVAEGRDEDVFLVVTERVMVSRYGDGGNRRLALSDERVVALVRGCMSGGWMAQVAELGVAPTVDAMLAYVAARGWIGEVRGLDQSAVYMDGSTFIARVLSTRVPSLPSRYGTTAAEALGRALLAAVAGEGATGG